MAEGFPVVVTGDLNSKPDSEANKIIVSSNYKVDIADAFHTAKDKNNEQFTDYWFDGENTDLKGIDYILVTSPIEVFYHEIINKRMGNIICQIIWQLKEKLNFK